MRQTNQKNRLDESKKIVENKPINKMKAKKTPWFLRWPSSCSTGICFTPLPTWSIEESYINSCQPGCYVPPQTEEECVEMRDECLTELYEWRGDRHNRILAIYEESMQTSLEIHGDEAGPTRAVLDEKIQTSKKVSTAAITNAQAKFLAHAY